MTLWDSIKIAFSSILAHKLRSLLTMLGIIIGVGSIITVVAIGQGGDAMLKSSVVGDGKNTVSIEYVSKDQSIFANLDNKPVLTQESIFQIRDIPGVKAVIPINQSFETVEANDNKSSLQVQGVTNDYFEINKITVQHGRKFRETDFSQSNSVILLSHKAAEELYKDKNPVGQIMEIKGQVFEVIGVYKSNNEFFGFSIPEMLMPLSLWPVVYGKDDIQTLSIQAKSADEMMTAGKKAADVLNANKPAEAEGKYDVKNLEELKKGISKVTMIMTSIIGGIAGISLLVGGIGVMNIMLVSVTERTREIGIRKALGATRGKILLQFLIEAMMLTALGGLVGIGMGVGASYIVSYFAKWPPLVSGEVVIGGVLFSMSIGIIFGLIPANKAAKLDPIEALRYE